MNVENFNHVYHFWREQTNYKHFSFKNLINDQVLNDSVNRVLYELFQLRISIIFFEKNNIFKYHFFHDIRNCIGNFSWMNYHKRGTIKASITTQYKWWNISILILKNAKKPKTMDFSHFSIIRIFRNGRIFEYYVLGSVRLWWYQIYIWIELKHNIID